MIFDFAADLFKPLPKMTPWEWCENHVILPPLVTNRPGPWRSEVTPYVREPMEAAADPKTIFCIFVWSAQSSKTQMLMNIWLWMAENNPMNTMWMMPSVDLARGFSKERLDPILKSCTPLARKLSDNRNDDTHLSKLLADMTLTLVGGNSAANLSSRPCGIFIGDEIDKLPKELNREACPVALGIERTKTYQGRRKVILASTPTTRDHKIWSWLEAGTYEKLYWPCPACNEFFTPNWQMVKWVKDDAMSDEDRAATAWIECPHCRNKFLERHKRKALANSEWRSTQPDKPKDIRSFHLSEIQSPFTPLPDLVLKFMRAQAKARRGDVGDLQNFVNSSLSEPWEEGSYGKRKPEEMHHMKSGHPRGIVPAFVDVLTFGADTQDNGFWYEIQGWGVGGTSHIVQEGFVPSLEALEQVTVNATLYRHDGRPMEITFGLIDSGGHRIDEVRRWCSKFPGRVMPSLGRGRLSKCVTYSDIDGSGSSFGSQQQVIIDTNFFKNALAARLKVNPDDPGFISIHGEVGDDFFQQITAEYVDEKMNWVCPKHHDNHLWDCMVYAAAAAYLIEAWSITPEQHESMRRDSNEQRPATRQKREEPKLWE